MSRELSRPLAILFLLAVGALLAAFGAVVARALGAAALAVYGVGVGVLLVVGVQWAKARVRAARRAAGRTCDCCTGSIHDPIQVI